MGARVKAVSGAEAIQSCFMGKGLLKPRLARVGGGRLQVVSSGCHLDKLSSMYLASSDNYPVNLTNPFLFRSLWPVPQPAGLCNLCSSCPRFKDSPYHFSAPNGGCPCSQMQLTCCSSVPSHNPLVESSDSSSLGWPPSLPSS